MLRVLEFRIQDADSRVQGVRQSQALLNPNASPHLRTHRNHGVHPPNFGDAATEWRLPNAGLFGGGHRVLGAVYCAQCCMSKLSEGGIILPLLCLPVHTFHK